MRIGFVWTGLTSYMADAWRRLAAEDGLEVKVWIDVRGSVAKAVDFRHEELLRHIPHAILDGGTEANVVRLTDEIAGWKPDALFVVGWHSSLCRAAVESPFLAGVPKVCCFDMPWRWKLRCLVAPLFLGRFLRRYAAAFVPGEACARYAGWLGFAKVFRGLFSIDTGKFARAAFGTAEPYFLYLGRNSDEKRLDDIRRAHRLYLRDGGRLSLRLYGKGLEGGFVSPDEVPALFKGAAAFVLASDFDPWPLVLLEAMAAGCPVIASDRCMNRSELGRNWSVFPCGRVSALAEEFRRAEERVLRGERTAAERRAEEDRRLAERYDCGEWVVKVKAIVEEVTK